MPIMEITTVIGCKISCGYCPQDKIIKAYTKRSNIYRMSFEVFKICIDKISPDVDIHFSAFSEPWLNSDCREMLLYAHKKGHKIAVFTSLVGMSLSDIDMLEPIPFKKFLIHLPSDREYEKIKIDENYLKILSKISKTNIKIKYHIHDKTVHPKIKPLISEKKIQSEKLLTRAGNIKIDNEPVRKRKQGIIGCVRNLNQNILLPDGNVTLCCMDFGLKHVLGNLLSSDHSSLFHSKEFLKVRKGLADRSLDILCRYCEFSYDISRFAKVYNTHLPYICQRLRSIHTPKDFLQLVPKVISKLFRKRKIFS